MYRTLVIYYSQTGQSKKIAEIVSEKLYAELSEIKTVRTYDEDQTRCFLT